MAVNPVVDLGNQYTGQRADSVRRALEKYNNHIHTYTQTNNFLFYDIRIGDRVTIDNKDSIDVFNISGDKENRAQVVEITATYIRLGRKVFDEELNQYVTVPVNATETLGVTVNNKTSILPGTLTIIRTGHRIENIATTYGNDIITKYEDPKVSNTYGSLSPVVLEAALRQSYTGLLNLSNLELIQPIQDVQSGEMDYNILHYTDAHYNFRTNEIVQAVVGGLPNPRRVSNYAVPLILEAPYNYRIERFLIYVYWGNRQEGYVEFDLVGNNTSSTEYYVTTPIFVDSRYIYRTSIKVDSSKLILKGSTLELSILALKDIISIGYQVDVIKVVDNR